jgi:hypothetical protein
LNDLIAARARASMHDGATVDEIADYLTWVEEDHMGLGSSDAARTSNQAFAARLNTWYAEAMASGS